MTRIYIAAPLAFASLANALSDDLRDFAVVSRWHRMVAKLGLTTDFAEPAARRECLSTNLVDLELADVVLALTHVGDPRATFAEIGWALSRFRRVVWVQDQGKGSNIFDSHRFVTIVPDQLDAISGALRTVHRDAA